MDYRNSRLLHWANACLDFLLLVAVCWISALLRVYSRVGSTFPIRDTRTFLPLGVFYAFVMVCCYAAQGSYRTLQIRSAARELVKVALTNLLGLALVGIFFCVFPLLQVSGLLPGCFYFLSVAVMAAKRVLFNRLATARIQKKDMPPNVLLLGSGNLAQRFYRDAMNRQTASMRFAGYLAGQPAAALPEYLGDFSDLHRVIAEKKITMIVVAEDVQSQTRLQDVLALADSCSIRVCAVPVYTDYLAANQDAGVLSGMRMVDLKLLDTCPIMGVNIAVTDMQKTLRLIETQLEAWRGKYICVANVHTTVTAHDDADYRAVQNGAVMALPDGGPLSAYSRKRGFADARRVTGPDLMREILAESAEKGWRHYFYGSTEETLALLQKKLEQEYPGVQIAGMLSPPFRELTPEEDGAIVQAINKTRPDFVWVGLGAPKQERWMAAHEGRVQALMVGVGAAFDYEAGNIRRAPDWMQKHNLEWLYRLMQDPRRLFGRYLTTNTKFLLWQWRH